MGRRRRLLAQTSDCSIASATQTGFNIVPESPKPTQPRSWCRPPTALADAKHIWATALRLLQMSRISLPAAVPLAFARRSPSFRIPVSNESNQWCGAAFNSADCAHAPALKAARQSASSFRNGPSILPGFSSARSNASGSGLPALRQFNQYQWFKTFTALSGRWGRETQARICAAATVSSGSSLTDCRSSIDLHHVAASLAVYGAVHLSSP